MNGATIFGHLTALGLLLVCHLAMAQATSPSPTRQAFDDWLEAFNSGDSARMESFDKAWRPPSPLARMQDFRRLTGGFKELRTEKQEPLSMTALLEEKNSDTVARLTLVLNAADERKIDKLSVQMIPRPPELAIQRVTEREAISAAVAYADRAAAEDRFSGAVLVAKGDDILFERAWGKADRENGVAVTLDSKFRLGSMNKMFTAVAVLQLVQAGKVELDAPIITYLADYPNRELASRVTVRQLLSHTGGTGNIFGPEFAANRLTLKEHGDYLKLFGSRAQDATGVGTFRYSNYGFVLLGALIEKVTGKSYYDYVDANVYAPAGMTSTASLSESDVVAARAAGYMWREGKWVSNADTLPWRGMAAGGGYSTVRDLWRFAMALQSGKLIPPELLAAATKESSDGGYGYGFVVSRDGPPRYYGHSGGAPGMNGELRIYPQSGYVVIVLSNLDPPAGTRLSGYIGARLPR